MMGGFTNKKHNKNDKEYINSREGFIEKISDVLKFNDEQIADIANISSNTIKETLIELVVIINMVNSHYNNLAKTSLWFELPNSQFYGETPKNIILFGKYEKLLGFVSDTIKIKSNI